MVFAQETENAEFMLKQLYKQYKEYGIQNNISKTELLVSNSDDKYKINVMEEKTINQIDLNI